MGVMRVAKVVRGAEQASDHVVLDYESRLVRRRRLTTEGGRDILVDLPSVVSLDDGDAMELEDGSLVAVRAAPEALLVVTGDLPRLAWHIGNRHTPCRIEPDHLLIRDDHVLAEMLRRLGAGITKISAPFRPERGAYGHGRTFAHDHN